MTDSHPEAPASFYLYCVVDGALDEKFGKIGIGGRGDEVYSYPYKGITAIISLTDQRAFERTEENVLAHQRVFQKILTRYAAVPLPFSSVFENESQLQNFLAPRHDEFRNKLEQLAEIVQTGNYDPGMELAEEALAQSFASALQVRHLIGELSTLRKDGRAKPVHGLVEELVREIKSLREEIRVLRSLERTAQLAAATVDRPVEQPNDEFHRTAVLQLKSFHDQLEKMKRMGLASVPSQRSNLTEPR